MLAPVKLIKILYDIYRFNDLSNTNNIHLSDDNEFILGYINNELIKLKNINLIKNNSIITFLITQYVNDIQLYAELNINIFEHNIMNGIYISHRQYIFNILNIYANNQNVNNEKITLDNLNYNNLNDNTIIDNYNIKYLDKHILKLNKINCNLLTGETYLDYKYNSFNSSNCMLIDNNYVNKIQYILNLNIYNNICKSNKLISNAILIICPYICIKYWIKYIDSKIIIISNKKEFDNITYNDLLQSDYVIISSSFFNNKYFRKIYKDYKINDNITLDHCNNIICTEYLRNKNILNLTNPLITLIFWKRIIIDECTELLSCNFNIEFIKILEGFNKLWCNTKLPTSTSQLYIILNELLNIPNDIIIDKKLIKNIIYININENKIIEENIILEYSHIEKILYKSYSNIYNIDEIIYNTLIDCKSIDEIKYNILNLNKQKQTKYVSIKNKLINKINEINKNLDIIQYEKYNDDQISKFNKQILDINNDIDIIDKKIKNIVNYINYNNLSIQSEFDTNCSICLEQINNDNIGITICGHIFCYKCIIENNKHNNNCPLCRCNINKKEIFKVFNKNNEDNNNIHISTDINIKYSNPIKIIKNNKKNNNISKSIGHTPNSYIKNNTYKCRDINLLIELYGIKLANLINYLLINNSEKIIIYLKYDNDSIINIGNILNKYNINNYIYNSTSKQKDKIINQFSENDINVLIFNTIISEISYININTIIFYDTDIDIEKQIKKQINNIKIIKFIMKDIIDNN
jgi:hypothetical protein